THSKSVLSGYMTLLNIENYSASLQSGGSCVIHEGVNRWVAAAPLQEQAGHAPPPETHTHTRTHTRIHKHTHIHTHTHTPTHTHTHTHTHKYTHKHTQTLAQTRPL